VDREMKIEKILTPVYIEIQNGYDVMAGVLMGNRR